MAIVITCSRCESKSFPCCGGGTGTEIFRGLVIDDNGTETKIYAPFEAFSTSTSVVVSDLKGNRKVIPLNQTSYQSIEELVSAITDCICTSESTGGETIGDDNPCDCYHEYFNDASGSSVSVTVETLPTENVPLLVEVYRDGGKAIWNHHFTIDSGSNSILFSRELEGEDVEVYICNGSEWTFENFLDQTSDRVAVSIAKIPTAEKEFFIENFFDVDGTNEVTVTVADLPTIDIDLNLKVYRDGGKANHGDHFTIAGTNRIIFNRAFETEDVQVYVRPNKISSNLRVYRDGGKAILNRHFTLDATQNEIIFQRSLENEDVQVYVKVR